MKMKKFETGFILVASLLVLTITTPSVAQGILSPADEIIAIDFDFEMQSSVPGVGENADRLLDGDPLTKYLNFGKETSGLIFTPNFGPSTIRSMLFTTADDEIPRDPSSWVLHGTNDPITSGDDSFGTEENWTRIALGDITLPDERQTDGPVISFTNENSYTSYRLLFPTLKDTVPANSMQLADARFYQSSDGSGDSIVDFFDTGTAVDPGSLSSFPNPTPNVETPQQILDGDASTKYLNFGNENSGFIVTPAFGAAAVKAFQITTANDAENRDPASWELYGTNDTVLSFNNSTGSDESWTLIDSGSLSLPAERMAAGLPVLVDNTTQYTSYRMVFPTVKIAPPVTDAVQFADIQFFNVTGDFNEDDLWDCTDVDALVAEIVAGNNTALFDMTTDGVVDQADLDAWLVIGGGINFFATAGNPFLVGDANLDGTVNELDFADWKSNRFTTTPAWCSGDFNADGFVDGKDFLSWNANKGNSSASRHAVPEPHCGLAMLALLLGTLPRSRK